MLRWRNPSAQKAVRHAGGRQTGCGRAVVESMEGRVLMSAAPFPDGTNNTILFAEGDTSRSATRYTAPDAYQIIRAGPTGTIATLGYGEEPAARWEFDDAWPEKFSLDDDPRGR